MSPTRRRLIITLVTLLLVALVPAAVMAAGGTFIDDDDSIFESNIEWLAGAGVTLGCNPPTNDRFCPNDNVTRGQMAAFMQRFAQYIGAEDGTPAQADNATTADQATEATNADNADTLGGKGAGQFQPAMFDFDGDIDESVSGPSTRAIGSVSVAPADLLCKVLTFETSVISVRASGYVTGLTGTESAGFYLADSDGEIDGTRRYISEPWGSFAVEWLYYGNGGTEDFDLVLYEPNADTYSVSDAQITAEVIKDTYCSSFVWIIPSEPASETPEPEDM